MTFSLRKIISIVVLTFLTVLVYAAPSVIEPVVSDGSLKLLTFPDAKGELINELRSLNDGDQLYLEIYELDDQNSSGYPCGSIEDALKELNNRNIPINLIYNDFIGKGNPNSRESYIENHEQTMSANGNSSGIITGYPSSTGYSLTHTKTFLAPGKFAVVMTANLIDDNCQIVNQLWSSSRDFAICTQDADVLNSIKTVFDCDIQASGTNKKINPTVPLQNDIVLSPVNSQDKLTTLVNSANDHINIYMEGFTDYDGTNTFSVLNSLANKAEQGIKVRALVQDISVMGISWNEIRIKKLFQDYANNPAVLKNLDIRLCHMDDALYIHAKVIEIDGKNVYLGSVNISNNSMSKDRELGIITHSSVIANAIENQFNADWYYFTNIQDSYYDFNPLHSILPPPQLQTTGNNLRDIDPPPIEGWYNFGRRAGADWYTQYKLWGRFSGAATTRAHQITDTNHDILEYHGDDASTEFKNGVSFGSDNEFLW